MRFQFECSDLWNKCHIVSILIRTLDSIVSETQCYSSLNRDRGYNPFIIIFTVVLLIDVGSVRSTLTLLIGHLVRDFSTPPIKVIFGSDSF